MKTKKELEELAKVINEKKCVKFFTDEAAKLSEEEIMVLLDFLEEDIAAEDKEMKKEKITKEELKKNIKELFDEIFKGITENEKKYEIEKFSYKTMLVLKRFKNLMSAVEMTVNETEMEKEELKRLLTKVKEDLYYCFGRENLKVRIEEIETEEKLAKINFTIILDDKKIVDSDITLNF